jgi:hypothetical protein
MSSKMLPAWARPMVASALCLLASGRWFAYLSGERDPLVLAVPGAAVAVAALLVHLRPPLAQMLARGALWSMLLLAALMAQLGNAQELRVAVVIALGCGLSLLVLGNKGVHARSDRFRPVAYRGTLFAALSLAVADTLSLAFWSLIAVEANAGSTAAALAACAAVMLTGIVGLYRLKTWGLVVNVAANLFIAALVGAGAIEVPAFVAVLLVTTAVLQLIVPLPVVVALLRGRPHRPLSASSQGAGFLACCAAPAAVLFALAAALQPIWGEPLFGRLF